MRNPRPRSVSAAIILILVEALIWLAFGIIVALGLHPALPDNLMIQSSIAFLAVAGSISLLLLVIFLSKRFRFAYYLSATLLGIIAILTVADDFGLADLFVLILTLAPLILLLSGRRWFYASA